MLFVLGVGYWLCVGLGDILVGYVVGVVVIFGLLFVIE